MSVGWCSTCKHWKHPRTDFSQIVTYTPGSGYTETGEWDGGAMGAAVDAADRADVNYGQCMAVFFGDVHPDALPPAVVLDGSRYFAALYTLADFGCTNHAYADVDG